MADHQSPLILHVHSRCSFSITPTNDGQRLTVKTSTDVASTTFTTGIDDARKVRDWLDAWIDAWLANQARPPQMQAADETLEDRLVFITRHTIADDEVVQLLHAIVDRIHHLETMINGSAAR